MIFEGCFGYVFGGIPGWIDEWLFFVWIGCIICITFGTWFYIVGRLDLAVLSAAMVGSLIAFLRYNLASEIFMGDTGSLLIGLTSSILAISFIEANKLKDHSKTIHDGLKDQNCDICGRSFAVKAILVQHIKNAH